jgi:hypothetical protein
MSNDAAETVKLSLGLFPSITNKMQRYIIHLFLQNALHVSGGSTAIHQELKTLHTESVFFQTYNATCHYRGRAGNASSSSSTTVAVAEKV